MSVECHGRFFQVPLTRWIVCGLLLCSCMSAVAADRLVVYAVNYPLAYFAERIGAEHVEVHFPAPAGVDPAFWVPNAETVAGYQGADLILLNGADYAKWVTKATLPMSAMVNTTAAATDRYIEIEALTTHSHGPEGEHAHGGTAFTTWLDMRLALCQATSGRR